MFNGFILSFVPILKPVKKALKKYRIEVFLILSSLIIALFSFMIYIKEKKGNNEISEFTNIKTQKAVRQDSAIFIEISGAVEKPDVYRMSSGARLKDLLILSGGLSSSADRNFFARNFNLARFVQDQEKIYVPSTWEINANIFVENPRTLDYIYPSAITLNETETDKTNINTATVEELDGLTGIGKATAEKIIANRPYSSLEELVTKKVVNKNAFENIKSMISAN